MIAPPQIAVKYKFSTIDTLSASAKDSLANYIALPDGLMRIIAQQEPCTPGQMICLACVKKPLVHKSFNGALFKKTKIIGWATLRACFGDDRYPSFHKPSPLGSYEMMAYVIPEMRYRGIAKECTLNLLYRHKVPHHAHIRIFAPAMLRILQGCDFHRTELALS